MNTLLLSKKIGQILSMILSQSCGSVVEIRQWHNVSSHIIVHMFVVKVRFHIEKEKNISEGSEVIWKENKYISCNIYLMGCYIFKAENLTIVHTFMMSVLPSSCRYSWSMVPVKTVKCK